MVKADVVQKKPYRWIISAVSDVSAERYCCWYLTSIALTCLVLLALQTWPSQLVLFIVLGFVTIFGRPFAKRFTICYRTIVCLSVSSVCLVMLVYCGHTVGWIKMILGMEVGLSPGDVVLDGNLAAPPQKGHSPPIFGPCLLWPNGCMDQDATWYGGRPQPGQHCVRWGSS